MLDDPDIQVAIAHHQAHRFDEAKPIYQALLKKNPLDPDVHYLLGTLLCQEGFLAQSHEHLQKSLRNHNTPALVYVALGHVAKKAGQLTRAYQFYQKALVEDPNCANAHLNLGHLHRSKGAFEQALACYEQALVHLPNWDEAQLHKAMAEHLLERHLDAKKTLDTLLIQHPTHAIAMKQRGQICWQEGHHEEAIKWLLKSLEHCPEEPHTHHLLGACYAQKEDYDLAIQHFSSALQLNPNDADTHHNLASLFYQRGDMEEARTHWLGQQELGADEHTAYNIGQTYYYQGRHEDAEGYFEEALSQNPQHENALIALGAMAIKDEDYQSAIKHYEAVLTINPNHEQVQYTLAALTGKASEQHNQAPATYVEHLFDEYAPRFDRHLQEKLAYQTPKVIRQCLEEHIRFDTPKRILDVGCGTGLCAPFLKPWTQRLTGVDLSQKMLDIAKDKALYHTLHKGDIIEYMSKHPEAFDLIVAADVLPYFGDLATFFKTATHALAPGGHLILTTENHTGDDPYHLQNNARFAHHTDYLEDLIQTHNLCSICHEVFVSRLQNHLDVKSDLFLIQKPL